MDTNRRTILAALLGAATVVVSACGSASSSTEGSQTVDITNAILTNLSGDCADYSATYQARVNDVQLATPFLAEVQVSNDEDFCEMTSNDIPNYDFNDGTGHFAEPVAEQHLSITIPRNPTKATTTTPLTLMMYNAILLNGVVLDQLSNGCYKPTEGHADKNGNISNGCGPSVEWRLNPLGTVRFGTDSHNGHTQPGGFYHYHGNPLALFDPAETAQGSPVIGFAADGFPIYGPHYIDPSSGLMVKATSGYTLKAGNRPAQSSTSPGGVYDGTYIEDYEYTGAGALDACNGMTVHGQYGYYVTDSFPYVMGCFSGTPHASFRK